MYIDFYMSTIDDGDDDDERTQQREKDLELTRDRFIYAKIINQFAKM